MPDHAGHASLLQRIAIDSRPARYPAFRRLWLGQGVSFVGYQVTTVAVPIQIYALTRSSLWVGLLGVASLFPLVIFGLWGGAVADVVDRRALVLGSSLVTWVATWGLLAQALAHTDSPALLLVLIAVQSAGFAVSGPTRGAIIPRLVPRELITAANTLNFVAQSVGTIAGPLLGAQMVTHVGFGGAYALDLALFTSSLYSSFRLPRLAPLVSADVAGSDDGVLAAAGEPARPPALTVVGRRVFGRAGLWSVVAGMRYVWRRPVLLMSFVVDVVAMGFAMPRALFPEAGANYLGGTAAVGWLYSAIAIGAVVGGLASGWVGRLRRQGVVLVAAASGWGVFVAVAGLSRVLWLTVLLLAVAGGCDLVSTVCRQTILQTAVPDDLRGRLQGINTVVVVGGPRVGDLRAGAMAAAVGTTASWVAGGVACVVGLAGLAIASPALTRYTVDDSAQE